MPSFQYFEDFSMKVNRLSIPKNYIKKILKLLNLYCVLTIIIISQDVYARHKCPKVPAPPGMMGFISSSTFIPSGSTMATARSSETFGCDQGHPSENFYKPQKKRVSIFLRENLQQIKMECAQGRGDHHDLEHTPS